MAKCSAKCKYYQAYVTNNKVKVVCVIRGEEIKKIKQKMSNVYDDCDKFVPNKNIENKCCI